MDWKEIAARLAEPLPASEIEWRVGSTTSDKSKGLALAYMTARAVMNKLDEVVGPENWQDEYTHLDGKGILCRLSLRLPGTDEWITKSDGADETDVEATKGGVSGALKRAAVRWGLGRYLYYLPSQWVTVEQRGKSCIIPRGGEPDLPAWALPGGSGRPDDVDAFTSAPPAPKAPRKTGTPTAPKGDVPPCPTCGGAMWDNRDRRRQQQAEYEAGTRKSKPGPAFSCRDKDCKGTIWSAGEGAPDATPTLTREDREAIRAHAKNLGLSVAQVSEVIASMGYTNSTEVPIAEYEALFKKLTEAAGGEPKQDDLPF